MKHVKVSGDGERGQMLPDYTVTKIFFNNVVYLEVYFINFITV